MASLKTVSRISSRLHCLVPKMKKMCSYSEVSPFKSSCQSQPSAASTSRLSCISRLPVELSSQGSLMPLHSAIAAARLISSLTIESGKWGLVPQECGSGDRDDIKLEYFNAFMSLTLQQAVIFSAVFLFAERFVFLVPNKDSNLSRHL